ncbi:MAG: ABC transporter substrate-binding protein [Rhodospirillales bacterium]
MNRQYPTNILILICFFFFSGTGTARADSPSIVVKQFQENLLAVMKEAKTLDIKQRYRRLEPSVSRAFHLPLMTKIAAGSFWENASQEQKNLLVAAFQRMSVSTLATLFDGYSGEKFKNLGETSGPRHLRLVRTEMTRPKKKSIPLTYVSKQFRNRWFLIDVIVDDGISELKVRRSEYRQILSQQGIDGLITALNKKADELTKPQQN